VARPPQQAALRLALGNPAVRKAGSPRVEWMPVRPTKQLIVVCLLQHGATLVVVECSMANDRVWRQRLEARAEQTADTNCAHKPASWTQLQQLLDR
jgi:hypothetical protein